MKLAYNAAVLVLAVVLGCASVAVAGDERPVVAVFDVQTKFIKLPKAKRDMLTDLMAQEIGRFHILPKSISGMTLNKVFSANRRQITSVYKLRLKDEPGLRGDLKIKVYGATYDFELTLKPGAR